MNTLYHNQTWKQSAPTPLFSNSHSVPRKKLQNYSYLLTDAIGKGYSSQVFRGRNDITNQPVAIKVINMSMLKSQVHQNLLVSQIQCLKKLSKTLNIIQLYEVYTTKNNTYIITELCQDGDLSKLIKKNPLTEQKAISLVEQLIQGYLKIYREGILHRDLKPANIFLQNDILKIADFGFAVKIQDSKKNANYNVGSPLYMPPQAINFNKYSFKSDIWALGIIFYQMLTGKAPWRAKNQQQLAKKIISEPINSLLPSNISQQSAQFLTKALQPDVNLRMSTQELQRFCFNSNITSRQHADLKNSSKFIITQRTQSLLKSSRNLSIPKLDIQTPKNLLMNSGQKSARRDISVNTSGFKLLEQQKQKLNKKQISSQLLSEIHFCRFLYKLTNKINEGFIQIDTSKLRESLTSVINWKLQSLISLQRFNTYNIDHYRQYKDTVDFKKIINIAKQYEQKYKPLIENSKKNNSTQDFESVIQQLIISIKQFYKSLEFISPSQVQNVATKQNLIILDYLITCYQLMELSSLKNLSEFNKKSKIETIVQGTPCKITYNHFKSIQQKLIKLKLIL